MDTTSQNNIHLENRQSDGSRVTNSIILGAIAAALLIVILTIVGELYGPLKTLLKEQHHHHWIGKSIWASTLFAVVTLVSIPLLKKTSLSVTSRLLKVLAWTLVFSLIILLVFFIYEYSYHA